MKLHTAITFSVLVAGCGWWNNDYPDTESTEEIQEINTPVTKPIIPDVFVPGTPGQIEPAIVAPLPTPEPVIVAPLPTPEPVIVAPLPTPEPIVIPPIAEVPATVSPEPGPQTGSANLEVLAQYDYHPRHNRSKEFITRPVTVTFLGESTAKTIDLEIPAPPIEMTACNSSVILGPGIPIVDKKYRYNNWWLIATTTSLIGFDPDKPVYFYWAKEVSNTEVGAVPTGFGTAKISVEMPNDTKINTGFANLPYQWISRFEMLSYFPHMQEAPCEPSKPRR